MTAHSLVLENLGVAKALARRGRHLGLELEDLTQEAYLGLCTAASHFDNSRGADFTRYASHWIWGMLVEAFRRKHIVRIAEPALRRFYRLERFTDRVVAETGFPPSVQDVASHFRIKVSQARRLLRAKRASEVELLGFDVLGLQDSQGTDRERRWEREELELVRSGLQGLDPRDCAVLIRRCQDETLEEIAADYGLTRERVRQIECRALERLGAWLSAEKSRGRLGEPAIKTDTMVKRRPPSLPDSQSELLAQVKVVFRHL